MKVLVSVSFIFILFLTVAGHAGPSGSGGGKGVVCRNSKGKVISVELLDLWEAENIRGYKIQKSNLDLFHQTMKAAMQLSDAFDDRTHGIAGPNPGSVESGSIALKTQIMTVAKDFLFSGTHPNRAYRKHGVSLALTPDSDEVLTPSANSNCRIEQLVTYLDSNPDADGLGEAFINEDLVSKMNTVNQAALYSHEALYRVLRDWYGETNSVRVRRAIGFIFSGHTFTPIASLLGPQVIECHGAKTEISISPKTATMFEIYTRILNGVPAIGLPATYDQYGSLALRTLLGGSEIYPLPITTLGFELYQLRGRGPTDYDRNFGTLIIDYREGNIKAYLWPELLNPGSDLPDLASASPLICAAHAKN